MQTARAVGRHAASRKYDIMTALGVHGLAATGHAQVLVLRFITLLTARYNLGVGVVDGTRLYAVGGSGAGNAVLDTVEVLDTADLASGFSFAATLTTPRSKNDRLTTWPRAASSRSIARRILTLRGV